jgi:hypothetical protein
MKLFNWGNPNVGILGVVPKYPHYDCVYHVPFALPCFTRKPPETSSLSLTFIVFRLAQVIALMSAIVDRPCSP